MKYEETGNNKIFKEKDLIVKDKEVNKVDKKKSTLSVYTYMNWKRFGVSVSIDDGIKINIAWFETNIKLEKR